MSEKKRTGPRMELRKEQRSREVPDDGGTITKVERQKNNSHRYNIYIDGEYAFSVHEDVLISQRILKGQHIIENRWQAILQEEEAKKIEQVGLRYLSFRPRTTYEMYTYLKQKGFAETTIYKQLEQWEHSGYLDDESFARQWMTERLRTKKKGRMLLQEELKQKGIGTEHIEKAILDLSLEDEQSACYALAQKKITHIHESDHRKKKYKLYQYLQRRGFTREVIDHVYARLQQNEDESFE